MEQTMLEMLLVEIPEEFDKMKVLHTEQAWLELSKVAHKMKSTIAFIGNEDLKNANMKIEQLTKIETKPPTSDEIQVIGSMMKEFEELLPYITGELKQVFETY